jgi:hypothetical protein
MLLRPTRLPRLNNSASRTFSTAAQPKPRRSPLLLASTLLLSTQPEPRTIHTSSAKASNKMSTPTLEQQANTTQNLESETKTGPAEGHSKVVIIGSGPAGEFMDGLSHNREDTRLTNQSDNHSTGHTAAIYLARANLAPVMFEVSVCYLGGGG